MSQEAEINRLEIEIVFLLEEPSAQEMLQGIIPKIFPTPDIHPNYRVFDGK